jgi:hypothetical protein
MRLLALDRERVLLCRALRGIEMALNLPLAAYRGVAVRMEPPAGATAGTVAVVLEHPDPSLSLTLYRAAHGSDIVAEWRRWGRALGVPLLVAEADGRLREPFERIGAVAVGRPVPRRRRRSRRDGGRRRCGGAGALRARQYIAAGATSLRAANACIESSPAI